MQTFLPLYVKQIFHINKILRCFYFTFIPALLFFGVSLLILRLSGFSVVEILRDPAQQSGASSFIGFLSNTGIFLWISSLAICLFSISNYKKKDNYKELLFLVGILSLLFAVDDFFMIHDRYLNEYICYLIYAVSASVLLIRHFKIIIEIDGFAFLLACLLLALSIFTDVVQHILPVKLGYNAYDLVFYEYTQIFEEAFKFVGGATWLYFSHQISSYVLWKNNGNM